MSRELRGAEASGRRPAMKSRHVRAYRFSEQLLLAPGFWSSRSDSQQLN